MITPLSPRYKQFSASSSRYTRLDKIQGLVDDAQTGPVHALTFRLGP